MSPCALSNKRWPQARPRCRAPGVVLFLLTARAAFGVAGVLDAVVIVADQTDWYKWPRELQQWQTLIGYSRAQVSRTEELISRVETVIARTDRIMELMGDPSESVSAAMGSVEGMMKPVEEALALETTKHALESSRNLFSPGSKAVKTYDPDNKVGPTYEAFATTVRRDVSRYAPHAMLEAMQARYRTAASNDEVVEAAEIGIQRDALESAKRARTHSDLAVLHLTLSASLQRQNAAHQRAMQAKADLDAFEAQLRLEKSRKQAADREWAEFVMQRMRDKALASYRSQQNGAGVVSAD